MRIALIGPVYPYRGGIAHYTTMLYQALLERQHSVLLVSFKRQYPAWLFPGRSDKDPSARPLKVDSAQYWIDSLNPASWIRTFLRICQYRPDLLVMQWWTTYWFPAWFVLGLLNRLFLHSPLVYICHNVLPHEVHRWDPWLTRAALHWGTRFLVQSADERERLQPLGPKARIDIAPMPLFDMFVDQQVPKKEARERLGLPADAVILLFFGIVREYKGLQDVLAALPNLQARLGRAILVVAGEFWDEKRPYLETIERLGLRSSVIIDDRYIPNEEVAVYFSAADALIAPYRQVTGSAVMQMANAFDLPVLNCATDSEAQARLAKALTAKRSHEMERQGLGSGPGQAGAGALPGKDRDRVTMAPGWQTLVHLLEGNVRTCSSTAGAAPGYGSQDGKNGY
jgi:glycosyltransferase involved in cell wall biosynthesis